MTISREDMIFDLSLIWSSVKEEFPYFDRLPFDWDEQYRNYLRKILYVSDEREFHQLLTKLMESLNDGHTKYIPPKGFRKVTPIIRPDKPSFTINKGVLTIKLNEFLMDHSTYVRERLEAAPDVSLVRLDIRDNIGGNTYYAAKVAQLFLSGEIRGCQKWTQIRNAAEAAGASQIVSDGEEQIQRYIRDGLITETTVFNAKAVMRRTKYDHYTDSYGAKDHVAVYQGPLEILISKRTASAAEDFAAMFKSNHRGTLIGEATCGSTGTPYMIPLRCGGRAQVVSVGYRLLDGTEFIGRGIMPDIVGETAVL